MRRCRRRTCTSVSSPRAGCRPNLRPGGYALTIVPAWWHCSACWATSWRGWPVTSWAPVKQLRRWRWPSPTACTGAVSPRCCWSTWSRWPGPAACRPSPPRCWRTTTPCCACSATRAWRCGAGSAMAWWILSIPIPRLAALGEASAYLDAVAGRDLHADVASLEPLLAPRSVAVVGAGSPSRIGRPDSLAQHPRRRIRRPAVRGQPARPCHRRHPVRPVGGRAARGARPGGGDSAGGPGGGGGRGVRAPRRQGAGGDHRGPDPGAGSRAAGGHSPGACGWRARPRPGSRCRGSGWRPRRLRSTPPGRTGLVVQSGGVGAALLEQFSRLGIGISCFAALGGKLDVSGTDMLLWLEADSTTELAVLHLESFGNPAGSPRSHAGSAPGSPS